MSCVAMGSQHVDEDYEEVTEEVFARRAQARQRQITIGKSRPEYKLYSTSVQYHRRIEQMPHTPDPHARISKRAFDRELACWRRGLHVWSAQLDGASPGSKAENYEERSLPVVELGQKWADFSPCGKDWSPAGTESTRADLDSEGSSPTRSTPGAAPGASGKTQSMWNAASNVKLNLFEHLSPPVPVPAALPPQQPILPSPAGNSPAMQQMMPALPSTQGWEMYPGSMVSMVPGGGSAPAAQMIQFPSVEQQQFNGGYAMPYWGEPMPAWGSAQQCPLPPQSQQLPLVAPQTLPTDPCIGIAGAADDVNNLQQPMMWQQTPMPQTQQRLPGTPRGSNRPAEDTPSTPLNRVMRSILSPAAGASPSWMRTPSPDHAHYNISQFRTVEQRQEPAPVVAQLQLPAAGASDPWADTTLMVTTRSYFAESEGYMSVAVGSQVRAMIDNPLCGDGKTAFPTYVYCCQGNGAGWVPQQLLWRCYVDESGRRWACDDATGAWCWVDEMEKNA